MLVSASGQEVPEMTEWRFTGGESCKAIPRWTAMRGRGVQLPLWWVHRPPWVGAPPAFGSRGPPFHVKRAPTAVRLV